MRNRFRAWRAKREQRRLDKLGAQHTSEQEVRAQGWSQKDKPVNTTGGGGGS